MSINQCCERPAVLVMLNNPEQHNSVCNNCHKHWLMVDGVIVEYTKKEWEQINSYGKILSVIADATCLICGKKPDFIKPFLLPENWHFDNGDCDCHWCECGCGEVEEAASCQ